MHHFFGDKHEGVGQGANERSSGGGGIQFSPDAITRVNKDSQLWSV